MLSGKRIILGVTGGIAAYKVAFLLREFQKAGAEVRVTMSPSATEFVGVETFASLSKHEVAIDIFPENKSGTTSWTRHIEWGEWADLFVIAPCTANSLGKIANGLSDNMLTATVLAARCPVLICPTMDGEMYNSPAVKANIKNLKSHQFHIEVPDEGYLASGLEGRGRLPEAGQILETCSDIIAEKKGPLSGKKVLVTAGPTREHIDPVRFISNPSSGKMGFAMAAGAEKLGGQVTLLHGPVAIDKPQNVATQKFKTAHELLQLMEDHRDSDIIIMAAAVADFTPTEQQNQKVKKEDGLSQITLKPTTDILTQIGKQRHDNQILIGFAMETENLLENASKKRERKNIDWMVANSLTDENAGFSSDTNTVYLLGQDVEKKFSGTKNKVAQFILNHIFSAENSTE